MKQYIKNNVDTQLNNQCFGKFNMLDNVELEIKVLTNGDVGEAWEQPTFELIGVKMDKNEVRQTEGFEVLSLTEHTVKVALDEQFATKDGVLDMQLVVKDNGRVSTCIFSFVVGKSLEGNIVESIRKIDTLDDLDVVVANLRDYEQQIEQINTEVVATNEDIKIEEAKRKQDELVRVTKETARANAEAIRQVNEEMRIALYETAVPSEEERQANEETRMVNETNRKIAEQTRISNENSRILAEQNRNETFEANEGVRNLQENKRVANENARINKFGEFEKNEIIRLASENNRLIQELERVNNEENRINAEANRQAQEDNREATYTRFNEKEKERQKAEDARQVAEQQRVNAELLRDQSYTKAEANRNKLYEDCETQRNADFGDAETIRQETYATAEKERYTAYNQAELTRNQNEELRKDNESKRITNENTRIANEELRVQKEATRDAKVEEFLTRGEQTVIEIEQRTEEFLTRGEQVVSDIEKRTDAALEILEGSAEEVADMRIDYMGNTHENMRQAANANVDYAVKTAIGEFNYLDYEGQHITANNSIEGHTKSAILKGNTLVNHYKIRGQEVDDEKIWANNTVSSLYSEGIYFIKNNTPHRITIGVYQIEPTIYADILYLEGDSYLKVELEDNRFFYQFLCKFSDGWTSEDDLSRAVTILQYQEGMENWDIPYFEGMQSVRMPVLTTTGKNLFDKTKLSGGEFATFNGKSVYRYTDGGTNFKYHSKFKENTRYTFTGKIYRDDENNSMKVNFNFYYTDGTRTANNVEQGSLFTITSEKDKTIDYISGSYNFNRGAYLDLEVAQLEESPVATSFESFKSNILSTPSELVLGSVGNIYDTLDIINKNVKQITHEFVIDGSQNIVYSENLGNTSRYYIPLPYRGKGNSNAICDKIQSIANYTLDAEHLYVSTNDVVIFISNDKVQMDVSQLKAYFSENPITVRYVLEQEVNKTVDLSDNVVYSYDGTTHYSCSSEEGSLVPTLSVKVPTDVQATIAQQRNTIQALESENEALKDGLIEANQYRVDGDMDLLSNQWDIDFRLFEIEMVLDVPMMATFKLKEADVMSRFLQAKTLILGGRYERSKMEYQLKRYLEAGQLTQEEYDELISLMDARELVE
jgi:hypothetical protein|nr:MAG TPA: MAEBL protein [Caudoviricetes sp.]